MAYTQTMKQPQRTLVEVLTGRQRRPVASSEQIIVHSGGSLYKSVEDTQKSLALQAQTGQTKPER